MNPRAQVTAADLAGCYRVEIGRWSPATDFSPPAEVQLTLETMPWPTVGYPAARARAEHRLRFRDETDRDAYRSRRWSMIGPSDVELSWSSDTAAVRAQVSIDRRSRDLIGTVRMINHPNQGTARIRLVRKAC
jgi:hypothetical protein